MGEDNPIKWPNMIERPLRLKEKTCLGLEPPQVGHVEVDELQGASSDGERALRLRIDKVDGTILA